MTKNNQLVHVASSPQNREQIEKWGSATKTGFQIVPNVLIKAQQQLELDSADVVVLLNMTLHWWGANKLPFPSTLVIANRMGVSRRTVERHIANLEGKGLLKRIEMKRVDEWGAEEEGRRPQHKFDLSGLVEKLSALAVNGLVQRNYAKKQKAARA